MSRAYKTNLKKRTDYIYYTAEGTKIRITPSETGVSETDIELLHAMDDHEVDEQRRNDYRVAVHLDAYEDNGNESVTDRNKYLSDDSTLPEQIYLEAQEKVEQLDKLDKLFKAMECLLPQQRELLKKVYLDKRSNTDIAAEEGVTEAAIRNRLKKIHEKLRKYFS